MTLIILLFVFAIMIALFSGLFFLIKDKDKSKRTVNALIWRVGLQAALIIVLIVAVLMGWLKPHDVYPTPPAELQTEESSSAP